MFKIFRLHEAKEDGTHWHPTGLINEAQIQTIKDPSDAHHSIPVTSIPSPFGRMHLVENAFDKVNNWAHYDVSKLEGSSIYHKLVSETWDIAQIFIGIDNFRQAGMNLQILQWKALDKIAEMKSKSPAQRLLAETLELFLKEAPPGSNLGEMEQMYILRMNFKVIGGTSPSTLFFSTPNEDNLHITPPIKIGNDELFDNDFCPLYKRPESFQRFMHLYFHAHPQLKTKMPLIRQHLEVNLKALDRTNPAFATELRRDFSAQEALKELQQHYEYATYEGPGTVISMLPNIYWYKPKSATANAKMDSDFYIGSYAGGANTKYQGDRPPLVLQNNFHFPLTYWGGNWDSKTAIPYRDNNPVDDRVLPNQQVRYPYLTVDDFLEPQIVQLPFSIDSDNYFDGNPEGFSVGNVSENLAPDPQYLLPINKKYFEYFDTDDLMRTMPDGQKVFKLIKTGADTVKAVLHVPVNNTKKSYVVFEREYKIGVQPEISDSKNIGAVASATFNVGIMPLIRDISHKRIAVIERDAQNQVPLDVKFFDSDNPSPVIIKRSTLRSDLRKGHQATSSYYVVDDAFDYIVVSKGTYQGTLIPRFPKWAEGAKQFTFAVDFGTTNSHIEYSENKSVPKSFDIGDADKQIVTLHDPKWEEMLSELRYYFIYEMFPNNVGKDKEFKFPTRTAISEGENLNFSGALITYGDFNPALYYEQYKKPTESNIYTNIKWASSKDNLANERRVKAYLESLAVMMRNKVLLNGGNLAKTKLIWFFPASMTMHAKGDLISGWDELFKKYFDRGGKTLSFSESEAPYYYKGDAVPTPHPVVNIDIGGGTTDVVIYKRNKPLLLSSFRFAGGALFGNGYLRGIGLENGFVKMFTPYVEKFLTENYYQLIELNEVFEQLNDQHRGHSSDLLSFFFSLDKNHQIQKQHLEFSFSSILRKDTEFKVLYYVFYAGIIYYLAKLMKNAGLEKPHHIFFSGNGSKILELLDVSGRNEMLQRLGVLIFERVYGDEYHQNSLVVHRHEEPKEATCKGGIQKYHAFQQNVENSPDNVVWLGDKEDTLVSEDGDSSSRLKYKDLNPENNNSVIEEVRAFLKLILEDIRDDFRFKDLGISVGKLSSYLQNMENSLEGYLMAGLENRLKNIDSDEEVIGESLFFYPLVGAIHRLGLDISNKII